MKAAQGSVEVQPSKKCPTKVAQPEVGSAQALLRARAALEAMPGGFEPGEMQTLLAEVKEGRRLDAAVSP